MFSSKIWGSRMAKKVAVINMKGGVGKSTLCINLAWHFAVMEPWDKKVLVVDLDPQFNASQYMLGVQRYESQIYRANQPTIWDIFEQATRAPGLRASGRKLTDAVFSVVRYRDGSGIDLIPSQLELSYTLKNPSQKEHLLANFISEMETNYDLIITDCAPTESILTTAAYLASDSILIPVKPEFLSTIGLPLIQQSLGDFSKLYRKSLAVTGVCFNHSSEYAPEATTSKREVRQVCDNFGWHVFDQEIPYSRSFPKGAREGRPFFNTSYRRGTKAAEVADFCDSLGARINL
jgi:chromosome partitioning protein